MALRFYKYEHMTCDCPDKEIFAQQCKALEDYIPDLVKGVLLHYEDDTEIQCYTLYGADVVVENDYDLGGVFVRSNISIRQYFP